MANILEQAKLNTQTGYNPGCHRRVLKEFRHSRWSYLRCFSTAGAAKRVEVALGPVAVALKYTKDAAAMRNLKVSDSYGVIMPIVRTPVVGFSGMIGDDTFTDGAAQTFTDGAAQDHEITLDYFRRHLRCLIVTVCGGIFIPVNI